MIKKILCIAILFCSYAVNSQNYLLYTPQDISISGNSDEVIEANIQVNCYGGELGFCHTGTTYPDASLPDNGSLSIGYKKSSLKPGDVTNMKFKFKRKVSTTTTSTYHYIAQYSDNNSNLRKVPITIKVTYNVEACDLEAPSSTTNTSITDTSARLDWADVSGANGYEYYYRNSTTNSSTTSTTISPSANLNRLASNTEYTWSVRAICSNGLYGAWADTASFTTLTGCQDKIIVSKDVNSGNTDNTSAKTTITATNNIKNGAKANYDAGKNVLLKPGFQVDSAGVFRAFIEGCTANKSSLAKKDILKEELQMNKDNVESQSTNETISLYPNPTKGNIFVKSTEPVHHWSFTTMSNKLVFEGVGAIKIINTQDLPKGIYVLRITLSSGRIVMKKVIKS